MHRVKTYHRAIPYLEALAEQEYLVGELKTDGIRLLVLEHPHVVTCGKHFDGDLEALSRSLPPDVEGGHKVGRMGRETYHGPGQLVVYPVLDLSVFGNDLGKYIQFLHDVSIDFLSSQGIDAYRKEDQSIGVWSRSGDVERKVAAIGVEKREVDGRHVVLHGVALNVSTNLSYFSHINPCGSINQSMTSMKELGCDVAIPNAMKKYVDCFEEQLRRRGMDITLDRKYVE